jgi:C4-dicarboxylate-binding protein DctP
MNGFVKKLTGTAVAALLSGALVSGAWAAEFVAKIGHLESAQQSRNVFLEKVAKLVSERTKGAVEFQIFPQGQLGQQREMTEGVQLGTLEATVAPAAFLGGFNPVVSILDIPFLLPDDDATAQKIRAGAFGQALCGSFETRGAKCIGLWPNGKKNLTSNKPIGDLGSFAGQKFRVMDSNILIEQFDSVGASAIALPFGELYTALQTGVVDGEENPLDTIQRMKFYEVQKYLVLSDHGAMEDVILFNPTFWNSMPEEYRTIITAAFQEVVPELIAHKAKSVQAALDEIKGSSIEISEMSAEEKKAFREKTYPATRAAYIARAGEEGEKLIAIYEQEYAAATK